MVKGGEDYKYKEYDRNCIWLLEELNFITSGLYMKANKQTNLHNNIMSFILMIHGETESENSYTRRFKSNTQTVILSGVTNIFYSEDLVDTQFPAATKQELTLEIEKIQAICF